MCASGSITILVKQIKNPNLYDLFDRNIYCKNHKTSTSIIKKKTISVSINFIRREYSFAFNLRQNMYE